MCLLESVVLKLTYSNRLVLSVFNKVNWLVLVTVSLQILE